MNKKEFLEKGNKVLSLGNFYADVLDEWVEFLDDFSDLDLSELEKDPEVLNLKNGMAKLASRLSR